jgi:nucleoside-diphosphate-sugar epimerase
MRMDLSRGPRVAVTGAGGFIGLALVRRLRQDGAAVVGLDVDPGARFRVEEAGGAFAVADTTDPVAVLAALDGCDGVVHTAARVTDWGPMDEFVRVNVGGTRTVLEAAEAVGAQRVVHVSSVATWGYEFAADLPEDAPPRACGAPYVDTKAASDQLALRHGAAVVRPGDVYGPGSNPWVRRPLETLRAGRFYLPGDGSGVMTPVYVDDLVDCVVRALVHPDAGRQAFTCWDGEAVTAREFFGYHARMLGRDGVGTLPAPLVRAGAWAEELRARLTRTTPAVSRQAIQYVSRRAAYPNERARTVLGWTPRVRLAEGMARSEAWARAEGLLD